MPPDRFEEVTWGVVALALARWEGCPGLAMRATPR
jgi:hypothetical protein